MRKVKYARLHELNVVLPGVGILTKELPMQNKTLKLEMWVGKESGILSVKVNNTECGIPLANVQFCIFDEEQAVEKLVDQAGDLKASDAA